jgi:putative transposase
MRKQAPIRRPPHVYLDDTWYIITASTLHGARYLATERHLRLWVDVFRAQVAEFGFPSAAWVVLPNHYHLLLKSRLGRDIGKFIGRLNGRSSYELNGLDGTRGRQVWYSYWETCIRSEAGYWTRFNYIHNNPVKHGYVRRHADWIYSSYRYYLETKGEDWLASCWASYPVLDYVEGDDF